MNLLFSIVLTVGLFSIQAVAGPSGAGSQGTGSEGTRSTKDSVSQRVKIDPENFRCIFVGDSQIATPVASRLRPGMRAWDLPVAGTFIGSGFEWTGQIVDINVDAFESLTSREVGNPGSWTWGGARDFMCSRGFEWRCYGDIKVINEPFATFQQYLYHPNYSFWDENWARARNLVARIAVRTGPHSVEYIETMARRGDYVDESSRTRHAISNVAGYQIIEQEISAGFRSNIDGPGVSFYFPDNVVEEDRKLFQVLGVSLLVVDRDGNPIPGMIVGAMAYSGWSIDEHLGVADSSRRALIELVDANVVMIMLGHNREGSYDQVEPGYNQLVDRWIGAFADLNRQRPAMISVVPWLTGQDWSLGYLGLMEPVMRNAMQRVRGRYISFPTYFGHQVPDEFNPDMYQLDGIRVHPVNGSTARYLSEDLEAMIFSEIDSD